MKVQSLKLTIVLILAIVLLAGTASAYKKIKVFMPQAPEISLDGVRKIAVLDFKPATPSANEAGKFIADRMIELMLMEDRGIQEIEGGLFTSGVEATTLIEGLTTKCFSIVERSRLEGVLDEQSMSDIGLVGDAEAARIGQLLGVDVMLIGEVSDSRQDKRTTEKRRYKKQDYIVNCVVREVVVSANVRIIDTRSGEILGTRRTSRTATSKVCEGDNKQLTDDGVLAARCANGLAWEFTNLINPWYAVGEFELEKIKVKEHADKAKEAAKAAEDLNIDKAYAIYKELFESDPYNPKYLYNMGVLYEVAGSFEKAKEMYDGAVMLKADDKMYNEAAERIGYRVKLVPFYADLDMAIVPHDFEAAAANKSLTADRVEVKGSTGDRVPVYAEPSTSSEVLANVPGKVQLEVIETTGDWFLVKLLGGKQGYIHSENVD